VGVTMCSSISSIRSSAPSSSSSSSRRLRRIVQQQQEKEKGASDKKRMDVLRKADNRSMEWSHDFEDDFSDSGKSFASSTSGKSSSVSPACPAPEQKKKDLSPLSKSPTAIFFRMLLLRCSTTRRKRRNRRNRVLATKLLTNGNGNGDYQTQEEEGNSNDGNAQKRHSRSRSIPTNEHEMFFQLHSTSRRSLNAQGLSGSSSRSRSFPSRTSAATRRSDNETRITTVQTDSPPPTVIISPLLWSSIETKVEHYGYRE